MDIINNEKDRRLFYKELNEGLKPLRKAMEEFTKIVNKIDWDELNKLIEKAENRIN